MMVNTDIFIDEIKKFRDPKNYTESPHDGSLYKYEIKKLNESDLKEYLELYYKIFKVYWNEQAEWLNPDFKETVNSDFIKYRPKKEHEQINSILTILTSNKTHRFSNTYLNYLDNVPYLKNIFLIIAVVYFGYSFLLLSPFFFEILCTLLLISFIPTFYMLYLSIKKGYLSGPEKSKLVYFSTITVSFLIILFNISPYGYSSSSDSKITCYKLANGKTECFSDRQYEELLDKYRN